MTKIKHLQKGRISKLMMPILQKLILCYLPVINLIAFTLFGIDKYKARNNRWRIRESTLWLATLLGGGLGAFAAMQLFRHKTKHLAFVIGVPLLTIASGIFFGWLYLHR